MTQTMTNTDNARDLFQAAYEHRYTWDDRFPGYTADLTLTQSDETYTAQITIKPDLTVEVTGIADENVKQSVYNQLRDLITHRKRSTFAIAHSQNSFSLGQTDATGAVEILVKGDAMGSNYKIRGQEICQVSRVMGQMAFTIDTHASLITPLGYLATRYDAIFRNAQTGDLIKELSFEDNYAKVGDYYLMNTQIIHSKEQDRSTVTKFNYTNLQLL